MAADGLSQPFHAFDFSARASIVAAVSGGSDSLATLLLLGDHLRRTNPDTALLAVTVDHGLRRESAAEAANVAALCASRGIAHRTMVWSGAKPTTGLAAAARAARYRLITQAAAEAGSDMIVTGHTADDQAETVTMRGARGDGLGLAGMAPATLLDGQVWVVRPLLSTRRQTLRDFLSKQGVDWIDDPTNTDRRFERPRIRTELADDEPRIEAALKGAAAAAARRTSLGEAAAALIGAHASLVSPGLVRLGPEFLAAGDAETVHTLRVLLAAMGGTSFLPDEGRVRALLMRLRAAPLRTALSRTLVDSRRAGIFLHREHRGLPGTPPASPGTSPESAPSPSRGGREPTSLPSSPSMGEVARRARGGGSAAGDDIVMADGAIWDGRFRIHAPEGSVGVATVGAQTAKKIEPDPAVPASLARAGLAAEPLLAGPGIAVRLAPPFSFVLPSFDLAAARAVADLLEAPKFPPSPWHGHD